LAGTSDDSNHWLHLSAHKIRPTCPHCFCDIGYGRLHTQGGEKIHGVNGLKDEPSVSNREMVLAHVECVKISQASAIVRLSDMCEHDGVFNRMGTAVTVPGAVSQGGTTSFG